MRYFVEPGVDPSINDDGESSPLDLAAFSGTFSIISRLLEYGAKLDDSNALKSATSGPTRIPMMAFILYCGFVINAFDVSRKPPLKQMEIGTALHVAAKYGHRDRIQFLLDRGANPEIRHSDKVLKMTPVDWAKKYRKTETSEVLIAKRHPSKG